MKESRSPALPGHIAVISSLLLIFSFGSMDMALSPMVEIFKSFYNVPGEKVLYLISACTTGIIIGVALGPSLTGAFNVFRIALFGIIGMLASLALFIHIPHFMSAFVLRFFFGLSVGIITSAFWWLTFHGLDKSHYQSMITVLMAGRPLATGVGMPLLGLLSFHRGWRWAFAAFLLMMAVSSAGLLFSFPRDLTEKESFRPGALAADYVEAFRPPFAWGFYGGLTVVKICYLGFYTLTGIWFGGKFGLSPFQIAGTLMYIGLAEGTVNFIVPLLLRQFGEKSVFRFSLFLSVPVFLILFFADLPLNGAIGFFALFVMLDRIYSMTVVVLLPDIFPHCPNKTVMGSLITLSSWIALTFIAWFGGAFLKSIGITILGALLAFCLVSGGLVLSGVMDKTVFQIKKTGRESIPAG